MQRDGDRLPIPQHMDGQMPAAHALSVDGADHRCMPSIIIRTEEQFILLQHLHEGTLAPRHNLPRTTFVCTHELVDARFAVWEGVSQHEWCKWCTNAICGIVQPYSATPLRHKQWLCVVHHKHHRNS